MKKRIMSLVMAACMSIGMLAGCGGGKEASLPEKLVFTYVTAPLNVPSIIEKEKGIFAEKFEEMGIAVEYAELTSAVSHDHPEDIKGAQAIASAIFLTRGGMSKEQLKKFITKHFGYDLSRTLADIRPNYRHVESCRRPSRPIWKASVLRMCSARLFHSVGTPTPSQLSLPAFCGSPLPRACVDSRGGCETAGRPHQSLPRCL